MRDRRIRRRFGRSALGWGTALGGGTLLLAWAGWLRLSRGPGADLALAVVAMLFLGVGLWLGLAFTRTTVPPAGNPAAVVSLGITPREVEVLALLAAGHSNKTIARVLGVSPNTVKTIWRGCSPSCRRHHEPLPSPRQGRSTSSADG